MSNFYAKSINPRTKVEEDCTFIDTGKDTFIEFKDGWKYNTKFFNNTIMENEAINQDGEEMIYEANRVFTETFGNPISPQEASMYFLAGLFALIPLVYGIVLCAKLILKWIGWGV